MIQEKLLTNSERFFSKLEIQDSLNDHYNFNLVMPGDLISKGEGLIQ